ncbi:SDR family NAD(P)-dependent oxidoreductase [Legionella sp. km772]|uniref:SDR family NAD(P)-dependent oxidoreductase n=1 Tax=Legionella sp. km772 TaxID=2498111 RepID=UPI000F8E8D89|nr:SDR family oxidoreductase [Legionella sp. km772]RUR06745.1 SDR family oxidoreductase [Legionella sp. km772]
MKLQGKLAIITGGTKGIGLAIAECFIREGAKVAFTGRDKTTVDAIQKKLGEASFGVQADVSHAKDMEHLYHAVHQHFKQNIDIIVANAGISHPTSLADAPDAVWQNILKTNIDGVIYTVQKALNSLNRGGSIILLSSVAAKHGTKKFFAYCASKAAVSSLAKSFAAELLDQKIRVNSISPGPVKTPILEGLGFSNEEIEQWAPVKRIAEVLMLRTVNFKLPYF